MTKEVAPYAVLNAVRTRYPQLFESIMRAIQHDATNDTWRATLSNERSISVQPDGAIEATF